MVATSHSHYLVVDMLNIKRRIYNNSSCRVTSFYYADKFKNLMLRLITSNAYYHFNQNCTDSTILLESTEKRSSCILLTFAKFSTLKAE